MSPADRPSAVVGLVTLLAATSGVALALLAELLSKSDIGGPGWSLRGNGALIVPFAGGPAVLAAGWFMLALWWRSDRHWLAGGLAAGCLTLLAELAVGFLPIFIVGAWADAGLAAWLVVAAIGPLLALLAGLLLAAACAPLARGAIVWGVAACLLCVGVGSALPGAMFIVAPLLMPLVVVAPRLAAEPGAVLGRPRGWLVAALIALPVALVGGFFVGMRLLSA